MGPNCSMAKEADKIIASMLVAAEATLLCRDFYLPIDLPIGIANGGPRRTVVTGWIMG